MTSKVPCAWFLKHLHPVLDPAGITTTIEHSIMDLKSLRNVAYIHDCAIIMSGLRFLIDLHVEVKTKFLKQKNLREVLLVNSTRNSFKKALKETEDTLATSAPEPERRFIERSGNDLMLNAEHLSDPLLHGWIKDDLSLDDKFQLLRWNDFPNANKMMSCALSTPSLFDLGNEQDEYLIFTEIMRQELLSGNVTGLIDWVLFLDQVLKLTAEHDIIEAFKRLVSQLAEIEAHLTPLKLLLDQSLTRCPVKWEFPHSDKILFRITANDASGKSWDFNPDLLMMLLKTELASVVAVAYVILVNLNTPKD